MIKLFLDDVRDPNHCTQYMSRRVGSENAKVYNDEWIIVRNYDQFVEAVNKYNGDISHISFDHDLADEHMQEYIDKPFGSELDYSGFKEKTGVDCAKYFIKHYNGSWPVVMVHSMNNVGSQNIINALKDEKR